MPITEHQARMYLALEGHLPETFLLEVVFGLTPEKAVKVAKELERLVVENNPAVRSLHVAGRRKQLRKRYALPEVADEEISIMQGATIAHQISQGGQMPGIRVTGPLGDMLSSFFGGMVQPQPHTHTEQDQPSNFSISDLFKMGSVPPPTEEGEDDDEDRG